MSRSRGPQRMDYPRHRPNVFAGPYLDRSSHLREQDEWLEQTGRDPNARFVPVWQGRNLLTHGDSLRAVFLDSTHVAVRSISRERLVFLGRYQEQACFLVELEGEAAPDVAPGSEFKELRFLGAMLPAEEA